MVSTCEQCRLDEESGRRVLLQFVLSESLPVRKLSVPIFLRTFCILLSDI